MSDLQSWRLKLQRAQDHLSDIHKETRRYTNSHPYDVERRIKGSRQEKRWDYIVHITEEPRIDTALLFGDFVHNLRSAIDHIFWACIPSKERGTHTSFPIETDDPWRVNAEGAFVFDKKRRERFSQQTRGMDDEAVTIVKDLQPYKFPEPANMALAMISAFDNADKHKRLILFGSGIINAHVSLTYPDGQTLSGVRVDPTIFHEDGTVLFTVKNVASLPPGYDKVDVKCRATAVIAIRVEGDGRASTRSDYPVNEFMDSAVLEVASLIGLLEPYVKG